MSNRTIAARYARALLDVSVKQADPRAVEEQLAGFTSLARENPQLQKALLNPAVPADRKRAVVGELATRLGLAPVLAKLLQLLADHQALGLLPDLLESYRHRLMEHLGIVRAEVVTAVPLPPDRLEAIGRKLSQASGKEVTVNARVDPSIIGGVVAHVGSVVYDGSVKRQLELIHDRMLDAPL